MGPKKRTAFSVKRSFPTRRQQVMKDAELVFMKSLVAHLVDLLEGEVFFDDKDMDIAAHRDVEVKSEGGVHVIRTKKKVEEAAPSP